MPTPTSALVTHSPELSSLFEWEYENSESMFIGPQVMPIRSVPKQAGTFGVIPLEELAKHDQTGERAPGSGYSRDQMEFSTDTYATKEFGLEEVIDEREEDMYADYIEARQVATRRLVNKILTNAERRVQAAVMAVGQYGARTSTPGTKWDAASGSTPIDDVETGVRAFRDAFGFMPDTLVMNTYTFRDLRLNDVVRARISSVGAGFPERAQDVTTAMLSAVFDMPKILVGGGMRNTANPGAAATMSDIWADSVLITKTADTNDMREACIGRTFHWAADGSEVNGFVETYDEPQTRSHIVRARHDVQEKILYSGLGYLLTDVLADH